MPGSKRRFSLGRGFPGWRLALLLVAAGLQAALGQAPWGAWFLALPALALVLGLVATAPNARAAFWRGWIAGAAQFGLALSWIVEPFLIDLATHGWMAPFALILMAGGLALFWAIPLAIGFAATAKPVARLWAVSLAFLAAEALRGYVFTGFPWALVGHIWIGTPVAQLAAYGGALALSGVALALSAALATAVLRWRQGRRLRGVVVVVFAVLAFVMASLVGTARLLNQTSVPSDIRIRLVQANVPQHLKWQPDLVQGFYERHLDLSQAPAEVPLDLVIWPESAAPFLLDNPGIGLELAAQAAGVPVVLGIDRSAIGPAGARQYFNALAYLDETGEPLAIYDKHHLVPFGEYIPLIGALSGEWGGLASQVLSGYTAGPGPVVLDLGEAGRVVPLICYEAVFTRNLRTAERPDWVLQITNDAWFGTRTGPFQHLAQARLRAIEFGLPVIRAANTGVSAVIDPNGRLVDSLPLGERGVVDAFVPMALEPTLYARWGDTPWHIGLSLAMIALLWRARRRRKSVDAGGATR